MAARALRFLGFCLFLTTLSVCLGSVNLGCASEAAGGSIASPCPPGVPCQARLTVLHTSDIHSRLYPYEMVITQIDSDLGLGPLGQLRNVGGVARMKYIINRERARATRAIHLDSGDVFQGAPIFNFYGGEPEARALSELGTDAAVIGNHEFDRGALNVTTQFSRWASFNALAANYQYDDPALPQSPKVSTISRPFVVLNREGLKIGVIGMANLSSLTSVFDQPNRLGITPLNTVEVAQFYVDMLRPYVDLVVTVGHLGLEIDQKMVHETTGIDVVFGGHNHIVVNPPQEVRDCSADPQNPGFVWAVDPNINYDLKGSPPNDELHPDPEFHPYMYKRACKPRNVLIVHSGAFTKYVGRLDLVLSNDPAEISPTGNPDDYDPVNGFEVLSNKYIAFPVTDDIPEEPRMHDMLLPYRFTLDLVADLDILAGFAPEGARRSSNAGGDSPLGNLVATAAWLRLGIQTDFSMTNTTGVRADLNPGPITVEQMYNIFPFDNTIAKMQLSGGEVIDMFDFIARRSATRGCSAQAQIAGARVRLNCTGCNRPSGGGKCTKDEECPTFSSGCDTGRGVCRLNACAEQIYIGNSARDCATDQDCAEEGGPVNPGQCDVAGTRRCFSLVTPINLYELATSTYLAQGGSGFRVLQRNTTQLDTKIQQRDALIDYIRQGKPCGYRTERNAEGREVPVYDTAEGLKACTDDKDCESEGDFVCACGNNSDFAQENGVFACITAASCDGNAGRCVRRDCRAQVAEFHDRVCTSSPQRESCQQARKACAIGGESCKLLACVDRRAGAFTDGRLEMIGR